MPYVAADVSRQAARRPPGYRHRHRTTAAILLVLGLIFVGVAIGAGWWSVSGGGVTAMFTPGSNYACSGAACNPDTSYATNFGQQLSNVYQAIDYMIIGALVLALVAAVFAFLGAFGYTFGRGQFTLVVLLSILAGLLALAPAIYVVFGQPGAVSGTALCTGSSASYCSSFFYGSYTVPGGTAETYGPYVGWYAAIVGFVMLIAGGVLYSKTKLEPFTMDELAASIRSPATGGFPGSFSPWAAPPPPQYPPPSTAPPASAPPLTCPRCGVVNVATAGTCWRCQSPLR